ncbi:N-acetyltransferase [Paenarthrobacter sp. NPDC089316]|uniref:GNAT family N-acetyltransferase n=1 Tax=unclassified Paenarthrobacter TaxID=2634190 RepID=UPI00344A0DDA
MPRVRRLGAQDWQLLKNIRLEMLADTPMAYVETLEAARRQTDSQWRERAATMSGEGSITLVADGGADGSRLCALMRVVATPPQEPRNLRRAMLLSVYVAAEHRGLGLADELLECACKAARLELGAESLELGVHEDNARAMAFYARHGFHATGGSRKYPQDTSKLELVMERRLEA